MFGLDDLFKNTIGKVINSAGSLLGAPLQALGLDSVVGLASSTLAGIPGVDMTVGGLVKMAPKLLHGQVSLNDTVALAATMLPPPAGPIASMVDLTKVTGAVVDAVGGAVDPSSAGGANLLSLAQKSAFELAKDAV